MQRAIYYDGVRVSSELLNYDITAKNSTVTNRIKSILNCAGIPSGSGSIVGRPGDTALAVSGSGLGILTVATGDAIDKNGEYISVPDYPYTSSDDFEPARVPTGAQVDVSGLANGNYKLGISYALASGCIKSNREGEAFAVRYYDSFELVTTSGSIADGDITLATFTVTTGLVSALTDCRAYQWLSCMVDASKVYIADSPIALSGGRTAWSLQDHVEMKGSATQTASNPHGIQLFTDFDELSLIPVGLIASETHGTGAHDLTVPISRTSSLNIDSLVPYLDGGGVVWVDGSKIISDSADFVLDDEIDWRYRWVTITGYCYNGADGDEHVPGGTNADVLCGYISPLGPTTTNYVSGHIYTSSGGVGMADPYLTLKPWNSVTALRVWVSSTPATLGNLVAKIALGGGDTTANYLAFGFCVEYGPTRRTAW